MTNRIWDTIIVGGGAAGLSAAQALGRSLRRTLVIDSGTPRNRFAARMHNVLGHDGTPPGELLARGRAEAEGYGVDFRMAEIARVWERAAEPGTGATDGPGSGSGSGSRPAAALAVELADGTVLETRALVVASGARDALPSIPGLAEHWGSGVLHCPYCHGWEVRGRRLAVIPSSPLALYLAKLVRQLTEDLVIFAEGLGGLAAIRAEELAALRARDVRVVESAVAEVVGGPSGVTAVRTADGEEFPVDAVFANADPVPRDHFLAELALDRSELPFGSFIEVDAMGRTSHPRIWAVGNVVAPGASVPMVMGAGTTAGAAVNLALVEEDFAIASAQQAGAGAAGAGDGAAGTGAEAGGAEAGAPHRGEDAGGPGRAHAHAHGAGTSEQTPEAFWEELYSAEGRRWSGRVNAVLADAVADLPPGRSLDLGSGEGGDALWLAERGWRATGIDLSPTAIERAREAAVERGLAPERARFLVGDLGAWVENAAAVDGSELPFDLVTASFLQSPVELPRERILRAAAERTAPGGTLVVIAHAAAPSWAPEHEGEFPTPEAELAALQLDPESWEVLAAEVRSRRATDPEGRPATLDDSLVIARRR